MSANIQQRREKILSLLYQEGHIEVRQITDMLGVSEATARRDLHSLAEDGHLELIHGGASLVETPNNFAFESRARHHLDAKREIGRLAAELIADNNDQVFIDSGTTCFAMAKFLRAKRNVSVIVNSARTAQELISPRVNVIMLGGQYRAERMDTIGPIASSTLDHLRGYRAFIGTDGLGIDFGPTAIDIESASLFGKAIRHARDAVVLADTTKFDAPALYRIVEWEHISTVITNEEPSAEWVKFFNRNSIRLIFPSQEQTVIEQTA